VAVSIDLKANALTQVEARQGLAMVTIYAVMHLNHAVTHSPGSVVNVASR
jgi:hypothetical protein